MDVIYNFEPLHWMFFALILIGFGYFGLLCIGSFFRFGIHSLRLLWTVFELFISLVHTYIHTFDKLLFLLSLKILIIDFDLLI